MEKLITILGPTATGKTKLASELAFYFNGEIISGDSRQVYKYMNLGTGKDLDDYTVNNFQIPYHLIDIVEPTDEYNLFYFKRDFLNAFNLITCNKKIPFLCGGTGLYLSSILQNYNLKGVNPDENKYEYFDGLTTEELQKKFLSFFPNPHVKRDLQNRDRMISAILIQNEEENNKLHQPEIDNLVIGVNTPRQIVKERITLRLEKRLKEGMIEEVQNLMKMGVTIDRLLKFGLEYKFITLYLINEISYNDMFQKLNSSIAAFAKRQMTWFRKMEREGVKINWIDGPDVSEAKILINKFIS